MLIEFCEKKVLTTNLNKSSWQDDGIDEPVTLTAAGEEIEIIQSLLHKCKDKFPFFLSLSLSPLFSLSPWITK